MKNHARIARRVAAVMATAMVTVTAAASAADQPPGLQLPDDLQAAADKRGVQYHEQHIGGRLERVTITRDGGLSETYRNKRADTIWRAPANEIGERVNMRQWIIWAK